MLIIIALFLTMNYLVSSFLSTVFANTAAITHILAIMIFVTLAMMLIHETRRFAIPAMFLVVVLMVALEVLAPYATVMTNVIAGILSITGLVYVKRPMLRYVRRNPDLPAWAAWTLRII